jgi:hypothetical protein
MIVHQFDGLYLHESYIGYDVLFGGVIDDDHFHTEGRGRKYDGAFYVVDHS